MFKSFIKVGLGLGLIATVLNATDYSYVGSDDLEAFPSDYVGKKLWMKCKTSGVREDSSAGGYALTTNCAKSDNTYGFMGFNPFKLSVNVYNKDTARTLAKSNRKPATLLGIVKKHPNQYSKSYIFEVVEVQDL